MYFSYILIWCGIIILPYLIGVFILRQKIKKQESKIEQLFEQRSDLIPSIFEVSKNTVIKHEEIFREIIKLRKNQFTEKNIWVPLWQSVKTQNKIHKELNFIFKVCNKHKRLLKKGTFLYIRDLVMNKSFDTNNALEQYKKMVSRYNQITHSQKIHTIK